MTQWTLEHGSLHLWEAIEQGSCQSLELDEDPWPTRTAISAATDYLVLSST